MEPDFIRGGKFAQLKRCLLFTSMFLLLILCSCKDEDSYDAIEVVFTPESQSFFEEGLNFSPDENEQKISFKTNWEWSVSLSDDTVDWCTVSPLNGNAGDASFTIAAKANTLEKERSIAVNLFVGDIVKTLYVSQEKAAIVEADSIKLSSESSVYFEKGLIFTEDSSKQMISFETNQDWQVASDKEWCIVSPTSGKKGMGSFTISVQRNTELETRSAIITLSAGTAIQKLNVSQNATDTILLSSECQQYATDTILFSGNAEEKQISFTTNQKWTVSVIPEDINWCTISPMNGEEGQGHFMISTLENTGFEIREATIRLSAGDADQYFSVKQEKKEYISLSKGSQDYVKNGITFSEKGGKISLEFETNCDWELIIPVKDKNWCTSDKIKGNAGKNTIVLSIGNNTKKDERSTIVSLLIGTEEISWKINQEGKEVIDEKPVDDDEQEDDDKPIGGDDEDDDTDDKPQDEEESTMGENENYTEEDGEWDN